LQEIIREGHRRVKRGKREEPRSALLKLATLLAFLSWLPVVDKLRTLTELAPETVAVLAY